MSQTPRTNQDYIDALTKLGVALTGNERQKDLKVLYKKALKKAEKADTEPATQPDVSPAQPPLVNQGEHPNVDVERALNTPNEPVLTGNEEGIVGERGKVQKPRGLDFATAEPSELVQVLERPGIKLDNFNGSKSGIMLRKLARQFLEKGPIRTIIPIEGKEKRGIAFHTVILNGLRFNILKGVFVEVPEQVAHIIEEGTQGDANAIFNTSVVNPYTGKVSNARIDMRSDEDQAAFNR